MAEEFEDVEDVDARNEIQNLSTSMFPLTLDEIRQEREGTSARSEPSLHTQQRDDVWIRLRDDEVIAVEELSQIVHG